MFWFEYKYLTSCEIFEKITHIREYQTNDIIITVIWVFLIVFLVFFIIPYINVFFKTKKEEKDRKNKKNLMNKIILQKNLEDIITRELKEKSDLIDD